MRKEHCCIYQAAKPLLKTCSTHWQEVLFLVAKTAKTVQPTADERIDTGINVNSLVKGTESLYKVILLLEVHTATLDVEIDNVEKLAKDVFALREK